MEAIIYPEWRNQIQNIRYPFADTATLVGVSGDVFPQETFVDMTMHPVTNESLVYLSNVAVSPAELVFTFSGETDIICSAIITRAAITSAGEYVPIKLYDVYGRPAGAAISTKIYLSELISWTFGDHPFSADATLICPDVVIPTPELGVRGFILESGELFTGEVFMVAEDGVQFDVEAGRISVNAVGDPLFKRAACKDESGNYLVSNYLKTINNVPPDAAGNFQLTVGRALVEDQVLRIVPVDGGLRMYFAVGAK